MEPKELLAACAGFQWDLGNSRKNGIKHRVSPFECEQVFFNEPLVVSSDPAHSQKEQRFYLLGQTDNRRLLYVDFTVRGHHIRVISARDMSRKERTVYRRS